jgi:hypothetical protein
MKWIHNYEVDFKFKDSDYFLRYLTIDKFMNTVVNQQLRFSRFDLFPDPIEGATQVNIQDYKANIELPFKHSDYNENIDLMIRMSIAEKAKKSLIRTYEDLKDARKHAYGMCLYHSKDNRLESRMMWDLYSNKFGVAMYISAVALDNIIRKKVEFPKKIKLGIYGSVNYINLGSTKQVYLEESKSKSRFFNKDDSYNHEKEFRYVLCSKEVQEDIYGISVDLPNIPIDFIVHPDMPSYLFTDLKSILNTYMPDSTIIRSKLVPYDAFKRIKHLTY